MPLQWVVSIKRTELADSFGFTLCFLQPNEMTSEILRDDESGAQDRSPPRLLWILGDRQMKRLLAGRERLVLQLFAALLLLTHASRRGAAQPAPSVGRLQGDWSGTLRMEIPFHVILHLRGDDSALAGTVDFPDQNANRLPLTEVRLQGDVFQFRLAPASINFDGRYDAAGDSISGTFTQGDQHLGLTLRRAKRGEAAPPPRPQEPVSPLPYVEQEVRFAGGVAGIDLAGTLTLPRGGGRHPAILLLPGSGPLDRDAVVAGHRTSLVIADQLTRSGFVVLRFDKRGVSRSTGVFADAALTDFAADAEAALAYLRARSDVDPRRVLVLGHSEGSLIAAMLLSRVHGLAGGILIGAPAQRGDSLMVSRARALLAARGVPDSTLAKDALLRAAVFSALARSTTQAEARSAAREGVHEALERMTAAERTALGYGEKEWEAGVEVFAAQLAWFKQLLPLDPLAIYGRMNAPVLALYGALDQQVPAVPNAELMRTALSPARGEVIVLPGINHQMQTAQTGAPAEYGQITETIAPLLLERITEWARARVSRR